jgi:hypothetical protein
MNGNERVAPQPVPDLPVEPPASGVSRDLPASGVSRDLPASGVTDEDRNRFGVLLDHAAERGLLSPAEYQVRLAELAEATSIDQLQRIVTELPVFGAAASSSPAGPASVPGARAAGPVPTGPELDAALWAGRTPPAARRGRSNPWIILIVMVAVLLVALVVLALVASHVAHTHSGSSGLGVPHVPAVPGLSSLRL